jgi:hypothetical protein
MYSTCVLDPLYGHAMTDNALGVGINACGRVNFHTWQVDALYG